MIVARLASILVLLWLLPQSAVAREEITIGAAHFLPFIDARSGQPIGGAIVDLVMAMNQAQSEYLFTLVQTSPKYRHAEFKNGQHDMSMFDNIEWGWDKALVEATDPYLYGGEVYIAKKEIDRGEAFFSDFENRRMIGIAGYHYGFANFNSNPEYLKHRFQMRFTESNLGSIKMVLAGNRGDVAVVTRSFLNQYLNRNPGDRDKLLVSKKLDQEYQHTMVLRKGMSLTAERLNQFLQQLRASGVLNKIWKKHGIL